ncbi:hypothetical protein POJ06DRAFT_282836 [Lipomyces tetrasporus]|uniref:Uncharacterized protein n=1 Tax=Lipomyces tetrasporus TaxID=54092 RepID=A0AAD7VQH1_9ASCO|nr:uncharacterized protein POJ06DRAFT_282836 [Lipomyces tetrasporus]KAJ8098108.1 hypothetical protein POJ06DRAFT_282836 [Lipomyces tetrasporus]
MGRLVKLIGTGIGLTTEAIKSRQSQASPVTATSRSASDNARDEDDWDLDDAVEEYTESRASEDQEPQVDTDEIFRTFMAAIPPLMESAALTKLPCPVIIPQRRPRNKSRGFIRAYAPVLEGCGIDQAMFMNFLKSFHKASKLIQTLQSSPSLDVINLAAFAAGFAPSAAAKGASIAVQEIQTRQRTNSFLDKTNNEFFKPRGLFCLIMTYKPDQSTPHEIVDISQTVRQTLAPASSTAKEHLKHIRLSSGKTYGEVELPESAPLIFPALDSLASDNGQGHNKLKRSQKFIADYFDRRAQATYAAQNPGSSLAVPIDSQFASRYSDPNHPANSGSLIALVTGGKGDPRRWRRERRYLVPHDCESPNGR